MHAHTHRLLLLLALLLAACQVPPASLSPAQTPAATAGPILLSLVVYVMDAASEAPVAATIWLGETRYGPAERLEVTVPSFTGELWVTAQAPGYQEWRLLVRGRFLRDKRMELPVQLVGVGREL
jgi:hypothetical protein